MCQCVSTASLWRVYGACMAFALSVIVSIALSQRLQGAVTQPLRSRGAPTTSIGVCIAFAVRLQCVCSAFAVRLQCVCSAFAVRLQCVCRTMKQRCNCVGSKPNKWYKSSLVLATLIVCSSFADPIMAVERQQSGLFLVYMHVQQVQDDSNVVHLIQRRMRRRASRRGRVWVRQWLDVDRRLQHGHNHRLIYELRYNDPASYFNFLRVPPDMFDELLSRLGPLIVRQDTPYRKPLEPGLKLAMTMRHLFNWPPGTGTPA